MHIPKEHLSHSRSAKSSWSAPGPAPRAAGVGGSINGRGGTRTGRASTTRSLSPFFIASSSACKRACTRFVPGWMFFSIQRSCLSSAYTTSHNTPSMNSSCFGSSRAWEPSRPSCRRASIPSRSPREMAREDANMPAPSPARTQPQRSPTRADGSPRTPRAPRAAQPSCAATGVHGLHELTARGGSSPPRAVGEGVGDLAPTERSGAAAAPVGVDGEEENQKTSDEAEGGLQSPKSRSAIPDRGLARANHPCSGAVSGGLLSRVEAVACQVVREGMGHTHRGRWRCLG
mmetsp:Transcript_4592/g.15376  ORF Transcript_4592/g.15376 Transcript_4592/m.15376 type:complete len:288 (-) Transcript_4592:238-1101(-)